MILKAQIEVGRYNADGKTKINIHFSKNRVRRNIPTKFYIEPVYFDNKTGTVRKQYPGAKLINLELKKIILEMETRLYTVNYDSWSTDQIYRFLLGEGGEDGRLLTFFDQLIKLKAAGNPRNGAIYQATRNKFSAWETNHNVRFNQITPLYLKRWDTAMSMEGMKVNARSIHLRVLRAVFNAAIDDNLIELSIYPFRRFKIQNEKTTKKALEIEQIKAIRDYQGTIPMVNYARDIFILGFYLIGINNGDLMNLKDIQGGRVYYKRAKTKTPFSIKVEAEAAALIEAHRGKTALLDLADRYEKVSTMTTQINKYLKTIGTSLGIEDLTVYHARHSWATAAYRIGCTEKEIGACLGHSDKTVTSIYILQDTRNQDKINRNVLDLLKK